MVTVIWVGAARTGLAGLGYGPPMARWRCETCRKKNDAGRTVCIYCSVPRGGGKPYRPEQWICPEGTRNDPETTRCECCGFEPPPRPAAEPAPSTFGELFGSRRRPAPTRPGRFCTRCGTATEPGDVFCGACGAALRAR